MAGALAQMPNIGPVAAAALREIGIKTPEDLRAIGSHAAFLRLREKDPGACLHLLLGLEGAVRGVRKKDLPPEVKAETKNLFKDLSRRVQQGIEDE